MPEGRALLKCRGQIVEAPFGHMKTYGGLARIKCRGVRKMRVKLLLVAVAWNVIKLVDALLPKAPVSASAGAALAPGRGDVTEAAPGVSPGRPRHTGIPCWQQLAEATFSWLRGALIAQPRLQALWG